jgi:saccharopine dehydrogenase-like NADP-dependent oxidoreductase
VPTINATASAKPKGDNVARAPSKRRGGHPGRSPKSKTDRSYDFLILGADGQIGVLCALYLLRAGYRVLASDIYREAIVDAIQAYDGAATFCYCDHRSVDNLCATIEAAGRSAVVINAADDGYNDNVFDACLAAGANHIDFGSTLDYTRRRIGRDSEFKRRGVTAITGCGSVPGVGGVMLRLLSEEMDTVDRIEAGFAWDSNQKTFVPPFFLYSVVKELSDTPLSMKNRRIVKGVPLRDRVTLDFPIIGRQTVYAVRHSEVWTFHHYFKHMGVRDVKFYAGFPKHSVDVIRSLVAVGLDRSEPMEVVSDAGKISIDCCDFLTALGKQTKFPAGYQEAETLWVTITGNRRGKRATRTMECVVPPIRPYKQYGCNIDTAFPGCELAIMLKRGHITAAGVFACESPHVPHLELLRRLQSLGFYYRKNKHRITI